MFILPYMTINSKEIIQPPFSLGIHVYYVDKSTLVDTKANKVCQCECVCKLQNVSVLRFGQKTWFDIPILVLKCSVGTTMPKSFMYLRWMLEVGGVTKNSAPGLCRTTQMRPRFDSRMIGSSSNFDSLYFCNQLTYRDLQYLFGKISTLLTYRFSIQRTSSIFYTGFACSV